jgi:ATP-binding protein involved in chromosome partitioning
MSFIERIQTKFKKGDVPQIPPDPGPELSEETVLKALSKVIDPDLGKDIVALNFVKEVKITGGKVAATVELTTPACPVKEQLRNQCIDEISKLTGVTEINVTMTAQSPRTQTASKPQKTNNLAGVRNIIGVASGKGGVGKSTTAVNLAYALRARGARVGILDADVYGPSIAKMTGVGVPAQMNGELVVPPRVAGMPVISSAMFTHGEKSATMRGPMVSQLVKQFMNGVEWGELDYLIVDFPPGTGDVQITLAQCVEFTGALIVTTPQDVARIDVERAMNMFGQVAIPLIGLVETMSYFVCDGCDKKHFIFPQGAAEKLSEKFGIPVLANIPMLPAIAEQADMAQFDDALETEGNAAYFELSGKLASEVSIMTMQQSNVISSFKFNWSEEPNA